MKTGIKKVKGNSVKTNTCSTFNSHNHLFLNFSLTALTYCSLPPPNGPLSVHGRHKATHSRNKLHLIQCLNIFWENFKSWWQLRPCGNSKTDLIVGRKTPNWFTRYFDVQLLNLQHLTSHQKYHIYLFLKEKCIYFLNTENY